MLRRSTAMRRRYHLPDDIAVPHGWPAQDGQRLRTAVVTAIRGAVRDAAPGQRVPTPLGTRPQPRERVAGTERPSYAIPSYGNNGEKVGIPVAATSAVPA